ncbi:unnamed protein product [Thelazia callipaeda]|uniref:Translin n=1 Tax=Thelazia callipaeda TaxID=103827 RepID=A0A0N5DB83_THECL|nr:unnamed protein product [Thelazia callipaeda]
MAVVSENVATNALEVMFESFRETSENDRVLKDKINELAHEIEYRLSKAVMLLQKTHRSKDAKESAVIYFSSTKSCQLNHLKVIFSYLDYFFRYHENFRYTMQKLCFIVTYAHFLEHEALISRDNVAKIFNLSTDSAAGFHLDIEDYLFGLLLLANELSRYSFNAVIWGNNALPFKIADFLYDLDAKFRLLNLRNDKLRIRYDSLKYDVQKAEQVVYDLSVRGLKQEKQPTTA